MFKPGHDPYALLGVARGGSVEEIRRAYRKLAMHWHPDRNATHEAEERFKEIKAAYELLLDPERLAEWLASQTANSLTEMALSITLEEGANGCRKTVSLHTDVPCTACTGKGRISHRSSVACAHCKGVGRVRAGRANAHCTHCDGRGYVRETACADCLGQGWVTGVRQFEVKVPPGMQPGERLRLARPRNFHPHHPDAAGDLFVRIEIEPHTLFALEGKNLLCRMPVSIFRLLLGGEIEVPTLHGRHRLCIEPYPQHDLDYRLPGLGYPGRHGRGAGLLHLQLHPVYPREPGQTDRDCLSRLEDDLQADLARRAPELAAWQRVMP